ncbi:unannotated protein [freshwater metagenome]|uniref:Unannotated protein n=1 Tax=freshwater metagenome TaxID=449393 RepID=A0A6J7PEB4_9ZZZZ
MPAATAISPAPIESALANATARSGLPAARGTMVAAMSGASDESGPNTKILEGPNAA